MHIFVTGATGWVGSAVIETLRGAGRRVTGRARSDDKAAILAATGAQVIRATLDDLDALHSAASAADAVIHTAFNHGFSKFAENAEQDRRAIEALGSALEGSDRPLLVTSGFARLDLPVKPRPAEHFGWFADFAGADMAASSARAQLGWEPTGPDLLTDIDQPGYYAG